MPLAQFLDDAGGLFIAPLGSDTGNAQQRISDARHRRDDDDRRVIELALDDLCDLTNSGGVADRRAAEFHDDHRS